MGAHTILMPPHRRVAIEAEIEAHLQRVTLLIARLDRADAVTEDMEEDDWSGTDLDRGEGEGDFGRGLHKHAPLYALDQSSGPTNFREVERDHQAAMAGLVRSATGGWRRP